MESGGCGGGGVKKVYFRCGAGWERCGGRGGGSTKSVFLVWDRVGVEGWKVCC